jgi:phospholipase/carboxylesterase
MPLVALECYLIVQQEHTKGSTLEYLTVYPDRYEEGAAYPLIFLLHGYGADMHDLAGLAQALSPAGYLYVLPNGPLPAFDGADVAARAWHERGGNETPESAREAVAALDGLVQEVLARYKVPAGQALLMGFSQGGAVALRYGLPRPAMFAGIAVLSGSLRRVEALLADLPVARKQRLFVAHGWADPLVPIAWSRRLVDLLEGIGYRPIYKTYRMSHHISPDLLADLRAWVVEALPPANQT